jgi:hypothetical protein
VDDFDQFLGTAFVCEHQFRLARTAGGHQDEMPGEVVPRNQGKRFIQPALACGQMIGN